MNHKKIRYGSLYLKENISFTDTVGNWSTPRSITKNFQMVDFQKILRIQVELIHEQNILVDKVDKRLKLWYQ